MMGQSPKLELKWAKSSGSSSLVHNDVLWHPMLDNGVGTSTVKAPKGKSHLSSSPSLREQMKSGAL